MTFVRAGMEGGYYQCLVLLTGGYEGLDGKEWTQDQFLQDWVVIGTCLFFCHNSEKFLSLILNEVAILHTRMVHILGRGVFTVPAQRTSGSYGQELVYTDSSITHALVTSQMQYIQHEAVLKAITIPNFSRCGQ